MLTRYLFPRRFEIDYISPPVCEVELSSSGFPTIILPPLLKKSGFLGDNLFWNPETELPRLEWPQYPGALCYTVYIADDPDNPFGTYHIVAECVPPLEGDQPPMGGGSGDPLGGFLTSDDTGDYGYGYVEIITPEGELLWGGPPFGFGEPPEEPTTSFPNEWWTFNADYVGAINGTVLVPSGITATLAGGFLGNGVYLRPTDDDANVSPNVSGGSSALQYSGNGFTVTGWFMVSRYNFGAGYKVFEYTVSSSPLSRVTMLLGGDNVEILADFADGAFQGFPILQSFTPTVGVWYFFAVSYDGVTGDFTISFNDGAVSNGSMSFVLAPVNSAPSMAVQAIGFLGDTGAIMTVDELAIFPKLQANQITYLYNLGAGRTWPVTLPDPIIPPP